MPMLRPAKIVGSVDCITPQMLEKMNIRALLLDLDGTLMPSRSAAPGQQILDWAEQMQRAGITLFILSNNKSMERVQKVAGAMGIGFAHLARKPRRRGFAAAARELGLPEGQIAMVGDQIFTDVLGGNRAGMTSILVETSDNSRWYHRLRRIAETPFRREKKND